MVVGQASRQILAELGRNGRLHVPKGKDPDRFGQTIGALDAVRLLEAGREVVVESPVVGTVDSVRTGWSGGRWYGNLSAAEFKEVREQASRQAIEAAWRGDGTAVGSEESLARVNAADKLTSVDTTSALTPDEQATAAVLQKYAGGPALKMKYKDYWAFTGSNWFVAKPFQSHGHPGLYDPSRLQRRGVLSLSLDRLTVYEALEKLNDPRSGPLLITTEDGITTTIHNVAELKAFDAMR